MKSNTKFISLLILVFTLLSFIPEPADSQYKLILFEGSDWCVNCIRLERNVLTDDTFQGFMSNTEISLERIDFPQRKEQDAATKAYNSEMAEKYNFQGIFPTIILVNVNTGERANLEYIDQSTADFIHQIKIHLPE